MAVQEITAAEFTAMIRMASHRLSQNAEFVNSLNVFPVPDGDTGTNMNLTFQSGYKAVNEAQTTHVGELAQHLAKGLLMGARGNSGVITSQIFRGFAKSVAAKATLSPQDLAQALADGVTTVYHYCGARSEKCFGNNAGSLAGSQRSWCGGFRRTRVGFHLRRFSGSLGW